MLHPVIGTKDTVIKKKKESNYSGQSNRINEMTQHNLVNFRVGGKSRM